MALPILDRLNDKTIKDPITGCWLYIGSNDGRKGYGKIRFNFRKVAVHRVSANLFLDLDLTDEDQQALHKQICPNKNCWNPEHLYIGTRLDNARDNTEMGKYIMRPNSLRTQCKYGHELDRKGTSNPCSTCAKIRTELRRDGLSK